MSTLPELPENTPGLLLTSEYEALDPMARFVYDYESACPKWRDAFTAAVHAYANAVRARTIEEAALTDEQIDAVTDAQWGKGCVPSQYMAHRAAARAYIAAALRALPERGEGG